MKTKTLTALTAIFTCLWSAASPRSTENFDDAWKFSLGDASSMKADYGYGTEYFNYWTKAASIHNEGPYSVKFDASAWEEVCLPHDWVVDLPFDAQASHSHGYKTIGFAYPQTSIGWYRKEFDIPQSDQGRSISLRFDGIFHSSQIWVNGFYLGREDDGYVSSEYDITQYLVYGGSNVVAVRVDASQESGWFYEGAGIYRHAWLIKKGSIHMAADGVWVRSDYSKESGKPVFLVDVDVFNNSLHEAGEAALEVKVLDAQGLEVAAKQFNITIGTPQQCVTASVSVCLDDVHLWDVDDPYLYTVVTSLCVDGREMDEVRTRAGFRTVAFDKDEGFLLNGKRVQIKGVNLHQDHAGVGSSITDDLYEYRLERLHSFGCNAIRSSHNPMAPALLDLCDSKGFLVIDENRLVGVNGYHREHLERMIKRDRNHPCVILWSIGNEEWGLEWKEWGAKITTVMREFCHRIDPYRPMTVATSSGPLIVEPADVFGFNYIMQNDVPLMHAKHPDKSAVGSEETSGCGTRGWYFTDPEGARMPAINRAKQGRDSLYNCIERGWQFYHKNKWTGGIFYWTGFDYRGESNPLTFPATGSSFGILDYCGFYKDEAWYLKSWWTDQTVLHLLPHWNLSGHEGEKISVWAYSNCEAVELFVNGRSIGRKPMPEDGHLEWETTYKPGQLKAVGYRGSKRVITRTINTSAAASLICADTFVRPGTAVIDLKLLDGAENFAADACPSVMVTLEGPAYIMGVGNGDSGWKSPERPTEAVSRRDSSANSFSFPAFNGCGQIIIGSSAGSLGEGKVKVTMTADGCESLVLNL